MNKSIVAILMFGKITLLLCLTLGCKSKGTAQKQMTHPSFTKHFEVLEDRFSPTLNNWARTKLAEEKRQEINDMIAVMKAYQDEDFATSIQLTDQVFVTYLQQNINNERALRFYQGIAQMVEGQYSAAEQNFNQLVDLRVFKYNRELIWYRALNYLALGQEKECKQLLHSILSKQIKPYHIKANQIINDLQ